MLLFTSMEFDLVIVSHGNASNMWCLGKYPAFLSFIFQPIIHMTY